MPLPELRSHRQNFLADHASDLSLVHLRRLSDAQHIVALVPVGQNALYADFSLAHTAERLDCLVLVQGTRSARIWHQFRKTVDSLDFMSWVVVALIQRFQSEGVAGERGCQSRDGFISIHGLPTEWSFDLRELIDDQFARDFLH